MKNQLQVTNEIRKDFQNFRTSARKTRQGRWDVGSRWQETFSRDYRSVMEENQKMKQPNKNAQIVLAKCQGS